MASLPSIAQMANRCYGMHRRILRCVAEGRCVGTISTNLRTGGEYRGFRTAHRTLLRWEAVDLNNKPCWIVVTTAAVLGRLCRSQNMIRECSFFILGSGPGLALWWPFAGPLLALCWPLCWPLLRRHRVDFRASKNGCDRSAVGPSSADHGRTLEALKCAPDLPTARGVALLAELDKRNLQ